MNTIDEIIQEVREGRPVVILDDEARENEGDLIVAAQCASQENIAFMARFGRGLICLSMEGDMINRLQLPLMGRGDNTHHKTAFTVSIEAKNGVTTGISAHDRAKTIADAINPNVSASDIATPGHVFPLRACDGGVLERDGHTEAAIDLAKLAGFSGAGVLCEIMNDNGTMMRTAELKEFAKLHNLKIGTIADLIAWRKKRGDKPPLPKPDRPHIMVVSAPFYQDVSAGLLEAAQNELHSVGATYEIFEVTGALEIPPAIALGSKRLENPFDGFVALGCVIRGQTSHYDIVCGQSASGITKLTLDGLAVGNGIITCENKAQAMERCDPNGEKNVGGRAVCAAISLINLKKTTIGI